LSLKQEYRSDRDDVVSEFFIPCLSNCIQYDRTIEYISVKSLSTLTFGLENIQDRHAKIRLISGHRFNTSDLNMLTKLFDQQRKIGRFNGNVIQNDKIKHLQNIINDFKLEVKIAIPNSEFVDGTFEERLGIFRDSNDDVVAFSGTSNVTLTQKIETLNQLMFTHLGMTNLVWILKLIILKTCGLIRQNTLKYMIYYSQREKIF